ncbi:hypothetical protein [Halogeometricum limi]|uniref:DUF7999 domain-containing protein n=1 Tax=Halogeometricum limi TaxID=555875 RepID=A0A1I6IRC5_9EURY|nr:hypothetical protein [Halogeometricum limi]SFR69302.1 hypothetical protein SAMN04488124_3568 [Halogeometricum limi]
MRSHPTNPSQMRTRTARIEWPMNDHGAMTVLVESTNEVRQLVSFEDASVEEALSRLPAGASVPLKMEGVGGRGNAWHVAEIAGIESRIDRSVSRRDDAPNQRHGSDEEQQQTQRRAEV